MLTVNRLRAVDEIAERQFVECFDLLEGPALRRAIDLVCRLNLSSVIYEGVHFREPLTKKSVYLDTCIFTEDSADVKSLPMLNKQMPKILAPHPPTNLLAVWRHKPPSAIVRSLQCRVAMAASAFVHDLRTADTRW